MSYFAVYFKGHWPVGAVAIVNALTEEDAKKKLWPELVNSHLDEKNTMDNLDVVEIENEVTILLDGDY